MVATVHVDLSDHAGGDSIPRARALRFDPLGDTLAGTAVLVDAVTVQIDRSTGQASHVNGRAVAGGLVPLAAGVVYRPSASHRPTRWGRSLMGMPSSCRRSSSRVSPCRPRLRLPSRRG